MQMDCRELLQKNLSWRRILTGNERSVRDTSELSNMMLSWHEKKGSLLEFHVKFRFYLFDSVTK